MTTDLTSHRPGQLTRRNHDVSAHADRQRLLVRIAGADEDLHVRDVAAKAGDGAQAHGAGTEHSHDRVLHADQRRPAQQCAVDASGCGFDHYGGFVAHVERHVVQLAVVGLELGAPTATGAVAEPGLDAGLERGQGEMGVVVAVAGRSIGERQREAPGGVPEYGLDDHPCAIGQFAHHLVAWREREAHPVVEIGGGVTFDGRKIAAADPAEPGGDGVPPLAQ
ncbi:unannotated protein [freshwater metagenome]|uniref:Unannotated protein n=1 Tax=freshwater metagenome TaxID=449393 RepID=A0A6J7F2A0_9ZZZZ